MAEDKHETLVKKASQGDSPAVEALVEQHFPTLLAYVRLHAGPLIRRQESCADIAQSVCREVLEDLDGFEYRGLPAFRKWLLTRTLRKLVQRKRFYTAEKRNAAREVHIHQTDARSQLEELYANLRSPSQNAMAREDVEALERALDRMPEDYRQVITLSRILGMSHGEIAAEMGRNEGTVRVLLHRALVRLGRLMHEDSRAEH